MSQRMSQDALENPTFMQRLGWRHRGFRVQSRAGAWVGLCLILLLPFVADQIAFQVRMRDHNPDLKGWLANADDIFANPSAGFYRDNPFYIYPPFFLTLIKPLTGLPVPLAAAIFETVKWLALLLSLQLAWRLCAPAGEDVPPIVALGSLVCTWRFFDNDFGVGNINIVLLAAVLLGLWLLMRNRPFLAGIAIAAAVSIKVTPALILVYFAYKRWWKPLIGAAIGAVIFLFVWPAVSFGWAQNLDLLQGWYHAVVHGFLEKGAVRSEQTNQAIIGVLNRLFGPHVAILPDTRLTIVELSQPVRDVLRGGVALVTLGTLGWICRKPISPMRHRLAFAAEAGMVLIAMLMLSGLSWKAHFVTLLLPYSVLWAYLVDARLPDRPRRVIGGALVASFAASTLSSDIITPRGADYAEAYGVVMLGAIIAGVGLIAVRRALANANEPAPNAA